MNIDVHLKHKNKSLYDLISNNLFIGETGMESIKKLVKDKYDAGETHLCGK